MDVLKGQSYAEFAKKFDASYIPAQRNQIQKRLEASQSFSGTLEAVGTSKTAILLARFGYDEDLHEKLKLGLFPATHAGKFGGTTRVISEKGITISPVEILGCTADVAACLGGGSEKQISGQLLIGFNRAECERLGVHPGDKIFLMVSG